MAGGVVVKTIIREVADEFVDAGGGKAGKVAASAASKDLTGVENLFKKNVFLSDGFAPTPKFDASQALGDLHGFVQTNMNHADTVKKAQINIGKLDNTRLIALGKQSLPPSYEDAVILALKERGPSTGWLFDLANARSAKIRSFAIKQLEESGAFKQLVQSLSRAEELTSQQRQVLTSLMQHPQGGSVVVETFHNSMSPQVLSEVGRIAGKHVCEANVESLKMLVTNRGGNVHLGGLFEGLLQSHAGGHPFATAVIDHVFGHASQAQRSRMLSAYRRAAPDIHAKLGGTDLIRVTRVANDPSNAADVKKRASDLLSFWAKPTWR